MDENLGANNPLKFKIKRQETTKNLNRHKLACAILPGGGGGGIGYYSERKKSRDFARLSNFGTSTLKGGQESVSLPSLPIPKKRA